MNDIYAAQLERALRTKRVMPYFILSEGPALEACPEHKDDFGLILPVDDEYWIKKPMKEHPLCKCRVRQISKREYEKIMNKREKEKMVTSSQIQEMIFNFLQSAFNGETFKTEKLDLNLEKEIFALFQSNSLTVNEVKQLPKNKQHFVYEFLSQYLMFLSINSELTFPDSFLTIEGLESDILGYMLEHKWPFPQMLE